MEILLGICIVTAFLYFNYKIVKTDIQKKKIPNLYLKYLLFLLPFWYVYAWHYWYFSEVHTWIFVVQIFLSLLIGFLIFHFGKWWAGDAKYLLVLALFIPNIGIIPFIFSIAIVTLLYLLWYFLWFWLWPNLWISEKRKNLYTNMWKTKKDEFEIKNRHKTQTQKIFEILKWVNIFLIFFICMRLLRLHLIEYLINKYDMSVWEIIQYILNSWWGVYIILWILLVFGGIFLIVRVVFSFWKKYLQKYSLFLTIFLINILWIWFIVYEYFRDPSVFLKNILLIMTLYLFIYVTLKMILFAYKIVFIVNEEEFIHIDNLEEGMIVDKKIIIKDFWTQLSLWYYKKKIKTKKEIEEAQKKLLYPDPREYFKSIKNPIDKETKNILQECYKIVEKEKDNASSSIKILNVSPFWIFIFAWFLLTLTYSLVLYLQG